MPPHHVLALVDDVTGYCPPQRDVPIGDELLDLRTCQHANRRRVAATSTAILEEYIDVAPAVGANASGVLE
jgi:hypothetical protein